MEFIEERDNVYEYLVPMGYGEMDIVIAVHIVDGTDEIEDTEVFMASQEDGAPVFEVPFRSALKMPALWKDVVAAENDARDQAFNEAWLDSLDG